MICFGSWLVSKNYVASHQFVVQSYILKQQWCLSVWGVPGRFFQSLPVPYGAGDKQGRVGRPGQPLRGAARGAISIKEILGENRGTCI